MSEDDVTVETRVKILGNRVDAIRSFVKLWVWILCISLSLTTVLLYFLIQNVNDNTHLIKVSNWNTCQDLNAGFRKSNGPINRAIQAEEAKPAPDKARLDDLKNFRFHLQKCGKKP